MNRSKDLRDLFRQYLVNERKKPKATQVYPSYRNDYYYLRYGRSGFPKQYADNSIRIFFYEWSDVRKSPRMFYQLDAFDSFLKSSNIFLQPYQKDIIRNLGTVFITCYTSTKNLSICGTYEGLLNELREHDSNKLFVNAQPQQQPTLIL